MTDSKAGIREFEKVSSKGWDAGVPLDELLSRVNQVAAKLLLVGKAVDSRISHTLVPRTFRHYQTLGCIDVPEKHGRNASYSYRHFLQALLVRRLLADGVPARRMQELVSGSGDELKKMILGGVEMVMRPGGGCEAEARPNRYQETRLLGGCFLREAPEGAIGSDRRAGKWGLTSRGQVPVGAATKEVNAPTVFAVSEGPALIELDGTAACRINLVAGEYP